MNKLFASLFAALLAWIAIVGSSPAAAMPVDIESNSTVLDRRSQPIPFDEIKILSVDYGGSGCPAGSAAVSISDDKKALTVIYDDFVAQAGPGVGFSENRRFCQLSVKLKFPQGLTFSIAKLDARGHATLESGVKGKHQTTFYYSGETQQANMALNFPSPYDDDYLLSTALEDAKLVWCPCGANRNLQIKETVQVSNVGSPSKQGIVTVDTNDLKVKTVLHLQWKWCPGF